MIPSAFEYAAPETLDEALAALRATGGAARPLSGGQSLIPLLKLRLAAPEKLVDLGRIAQLRRIAADADPISIGAFATHAQIEDSAPLRSACPLLAEVAGSIGDRQVRNRGTIGGSLAHADPAADWPAAVLALGAELVAVAPSGSRRVIPAREFFKGLMTTALAPGELIVEVRLRRPAPGGAAYQKVRQSASGFALAGVAVVLEYGAGRVCTHAAIGVTGVASRAFRAAAAEKALTGKKLDETSISAAAQLTAKDVQGPLSDLHASGEYRVHLARVHCARALRRAAGL